MSCAGVESAIGPVGPFGTLSPSDCYPAGQAGPYVAGVPVGPDVMLSSLPLGGMLLLALVGCLGMCPRLPPVLRSWWTLGGSTLLPGEGGPKFCPDVLKDDLVLGSAVPLPAVRDLRGGLITGGSAGR